MSELTIYKSKIILNNRYMQYIQTASFVVAGVVYRGVIITSNNPSLFEVKQFVNDQKYHSIKTSDDTYFVSLQSSPDLPDIILAIIGNAPNFITTTTNEKEWHFLNSAGPATDSNINLENQFTNLFVSNSSQLYINSINDKPFLSTSAGVFSFEFIQESAPTVGGIVLNTAEDYINKNYLVPYGNAGENDELRASELFTFNPETYTLSAENIVTSSLNSAENMIKIKKPLFTKNKILYFTANKLNILMQHIIGENGGIIVNRFPDGPVEYTLPSDSNISFFAEIEDKDTFSFIICNPQSHNIKLIPGVPMLILGSDIVLPGTTRTITLCRDGQTYCIL